MVCDIHWRNWSVYVLDTSWHLHILSTWYHSSQILHVSFKNLLINHMQWQRNTLFLFHCSGLFHLRTNLSPMFLKVNDIEISSSLLRISIFFQYYCCIVDSWDIKVGLLKLKKIHFPFYLWINIFIFNLIAVCKKQLRSKIEMISFMIFIPKGIDKTQQGLIYQDKKWSLEV